MPRSSVQERERGMSKSQIVYCAPCFRAWDRLSFEAKKKARPSHAVTTVGGTAYCGPCAADAQLAAECEDQENREARQ
jgi:hypothetical protein